MSADDLRDDATLRVLRGLAVPDVTAARASLVRERCHRALRRRGWLVRLAGIPEVSFGQRILEPAIIATLCAVYLSEVVRRALWLFGA